ncbi:MAG: TRAP transporter small permease [Desulfovibrio sp.]|jgi:TRAP-type C4-dicarboxylate transport system permease small subunit|nr:TRAP transporter small permease [Desulfovibrio sp.]
MEVLLKIEDTLDKSILFVCILMLAAMTCFAGVQVFCRYVLSAGVIWLEEVCRFLFCWASLLGACCCLRRKRHVAMTLLIQSIPIRVRKPVIIASQALSCILFAVLIKYGMILVEIATTQTSPALGLDMGYIYSVVPISGAIMMFFALTSILRDIVTPAEKLEIGGE